MTSSPASKLLPRTGRHIHIGVTGHRHVRAGHARLLPVVARECLRLRRTFPGKRFRLLSGLAEGADRLVAHVASETLAAELIAVLPMPPAAYMRDFARSTSRAAFLELLRRARDIVEAPLLVAAASVREDRGARSEQYAWAGAFIAGHADVLVALWDGAPTRGRGGTAEIVDWFRTGSAPQGYIMPNPDRADSGPPRVRHLVHIDPSTLKVRRWRLPARPSEPGHLD